MQYFLKAATREERPHTAKWERVVEILQTAFRGGRLPTECTCQMLVLIPKENGYFKGIGHVEVIWKALSVVVNRRIRELVQFCDVLRGFWEGR